MQKKIKDDTIYRQDAIKALKNMMVPYEPLYVCISKSERDRTLKRAIDVISTLPSTQPEPREVVPHRTYKKYQYLSDYWCECGRYLGKKGDVTYCPDCGRKVIWNE